MDASTTRMKLMRELLGARGAGRTVDELTRALQLSRSAIQQHITALERDGLVDVAQERTTGGRPSRAYALTEAGQESFPRQYAMLAHRLIVAYGRELGEQAVESLLRSMASTLVAELSSRVEGKPGRERTAEVVRIMNELGYGAELVNGGEGIEASNCIYQKLAMETRGICRFDVDVLGRLLGRSLEHVSCLVDGDARCRFLGQLGTQTRK